MEIGRIKKEPETSDWNTVSPLKKWLLFILKGLISGEETAGSKYDFYDKYEWSQKLLPTLYEFWQVN